MAQRLIRLPWQQQPQEVVLRPSEQYADLHAGWLGSQPGVLVGAAGAAWSRVGSPIIEPSRAGLASRAASYSTAAYYTGPSISGASLAWPGITVVAVLPAFVSVGSDFPAAVCIAPTGEYYGVGMLSFQISGYNSILWRPGDSGNYLSATAYNNTALSHEWAAGEDLVIVARWDKTTAKLAVSRSGSIMRNSASHSYGWRSGTNLMQIGGYVRSGNRMLVSPLAMAAVLPRDVGDRAESELLDNPWQIFGDQRIWVPVSTGSSDVTAPSVSASFAWAATASQPIVDTLAPAVGASITWAASAPVPLVDILAPSAAAAFAWAANASTPAIEDGAVVAPEVSSSFAWSATAAAPIVDVLAPGVSAAWTWQANPSAPIVQSDIAAPAVGAQVHWAAHALAPNIEGDHETIGSYDDAPWPSLPVRVRAAAPARFSWRANATRPRISVPPRPVAAPVAQATMRWTGSDARPRGLLLTRTGAPAAAPAAWPVRFCSHCGAPVERALH